MPDYTSSDYLTLPISFIRENLENFTVLELLSFSNLRFELNLHTSKILLRTKADLIHLLRTKLSSSTDDDILQAVAKQLISANKTSVLYFSKKELLKTLNAQAKKMKSNRVFLVKDVETHSTVLIQLKHIIDSFDLFIFHYPEDCSSFYLVNLNVTPSIKESL